jgi:hypothetical protein
MLTTFVLIFAMAGQPPAQLGTYQTEQACTQAIRNIFAMNIYKGAQDTPQVKAAVDTMMLFQQEYKCMPTQISKKAK